MPRPSSLACVRCGAHYSLDHYDRACAACAAQNIAANLTVCYDAAPGVSLARNAVSRRPRSLWRWDAFMPAAAEDAVTLGEGDTPLIPAPGLGLGDVWIKDELRNPTWSFKDRLASSAVTMARAVGAKVIASSSSGQRRCISRGIRGESRASLHRLHLHGRGGTAGHADARLWRHGGDGRAQR